MSSVALFALYESTRGTGWRNKTGWLGGGDPGGWFGVRCNASGAVTRISLVVSDAVSDACPPVGGAMSCPTGWESNGNMLSGTLPVQIGEFEALEEFDISYNNVTGTMPTQLSLVTNLEKLGLKNTPFLSGTIPTQLLALEIEERRSQGS